MALARIRDCVQKLVNGDPPLVHKFSNPVKVRLTPEGKDLAARLYAIAVTAGDVGALPGFDASETLAKAACTSPATAVPGATGARTSAAANAAVYPSPGAAKATTRKDAATRNVKVAGTAAAGPLKRDKENTEVHSCVVDDRSCGRGVAKSMGAKLAAEARKKKRRRAAVELEVFSDSPKGAAYAAAS
jgi:predicted GNAT family acetyltransferase